MKMKDLAIAALGAILIASSSLAETNAQTNAAFSVYDWYFRPQPPPWNTNHVFVTNDTPHCSLHPSVVLEEGYVPIIYGLVVEEPEVRAASTNFPNANPYRVGGCTFGGYMMSPKERQVFFCPACRRARDECLRKFAPEELEWEQNRLRKREERQNKSIDGTK